MSKRDSKIVKVPFKCYVQGACTSNVLTMGITPTSNFQRLQTVCETFSLYRFTKFAFRLVSRYPAQTSYDEVFACYVSGGIGGTPTSGSDCMESLYSCRIYQCATTTTGLFPPAHTEWVHIPRAVLAGPLPWYKTVLSASVDTWEELIGSIKIYATNVSTQVVGLECKGVCEFKDAIDIDLSMTREQRLERTRARLLRLMAGEDPDQTESGIPVPIAESKKPAKPGPLKGLPRQ